MKCLTAYKLNVMLLDHANVSSDEITDWVKEALELHIEDCKVTVILEDKVEDFMISPDLEFADA